MTGKKKKTDKKKKKKKKKVKKKKKKKKKNTQFTQHRGCRHAQRRRCWCGISDKAVSNGLAERDHPILRGCGNVLTPFDWDARPGQDGII
jgi:hypothetical protein